MIGYKYCKCDQQIPARLKVCTHCNYEFVKGDKFLGPQVLSKEDILLYRYCKKFGKEPQELLVFTPSGSLPFKFKEDFFEWFYEIIYFGKSKKLFYTPDALKYFLIQEFGFNSKKYKKGLEAIEEFIL